MNATPDFSAVVQDYERLTEPLTAAVARQTLALANIAPGERIIDVAAGTGALAVAAAAHGAHVLATDVAPQMVARAAERLRPFSGCETRVMDLTALDVADASFDAAFSIFGTMVFTGWEKGLRELMRVTRPGGQVAVTAWTYGRDEGPALLIRRIFAETFPGRELWPDDFFPIWSEESFAAALRHAGCVDVEMRVGRTVWHMPRLEGILEASEPILRLFPGFAALTDAERVHLRKPIETAMAAYAKPDGSVAMPALAHIGIGRRPS